MVYDPSKSDDVEMLSLLAFGLILHMEQVVAGEKDPFPYPDALLCGFNQLILACALRDLPRAQPQLVFLNLYQPGELCRCQSGA